MAEDEVTIEEVRAAAGQLKDIMPTLEKWMSHKGAGNSEGVHTAEQESLFGEVFELRAELIKQNDRTLSQMIGRQLVKGARDGAGIPLAQWQAQTGMGSVLAQVMNANPDVAKLLDTTGGVALVRQDLEPLLYSAFVRKFPMWDRINKIPSNGLVHAYDRADQAPEAAFMSELGTVSSGTGTYTRATTNIAIAALKVGVSFKQQFAPSAHGSSEAREIELGLVGLRRTLQRTLFSGNATTPGKVATDPEGLYDKNAFDGFRGLIPSANRRTLLTGTETMLQALNNTDKLLSPTGGQASIIVMDAVDRATFMNELQANVRYLPREALVPGLPEVEAVSMGVSGQVPILGIPGNEMGHYTYSATDVRDIYLLDESGIDIPYLGSDMPTILDIPAGIDGSLTHTFILFTMCGLAVRIPSFQAALRLPL